MLDRAQNLLALEERLVLLINSIVIVKKRLQNYLKSFFVGLNS